MLRKSNKPGRKLPFPGVTSKNPTCCFSEHVQPVPYARETVDRNGTWLTAALPHCRSDFWTTRCWVGFIERPGIASEVVVST